MLEYEQKEGLTVGIGKQIRAGRERLGLTQGELAKQLGITKSAVGNYENEVSHPKEPVLYKLFQVLGCDANYLFAGHYPAGPAGVQAALTAEEEALLGCYRQLDDYSRELVETILQKEVERCRRAKTAARRASTKIIPFYALPVSAGTGVYLDSSDTEDLEVPLTPASARADCALRVCGDSMMPDYLDGDILLVRQQEAVPVGELGVFTLDGEGYFKRFGGDRLISLNPAYPDIPLARFEQVSCSGQVVGKL